MIPGCFDCIQNPEICFCKIAGIKLQIVEKREEDMDTASLESLLQHIEGMKHDYMAYTAGGVERFYYLAELKRLARELRR